MKISFLHTVLKHFLSVQTILTHFALPFSTAHAVRSTPHPEPTCVPINTSLTR